MIDTKLTTCGNLLYQWILARVAEGGRIKVDLQDFQAWTAEYREKPYSDREILDALRQLKELQLIDVSKTEVTLEVNQPFHPVFSPQTDAHLLMTQCDRPERFKMLRTIVGSVLFGLAAISVGIAIGKLQSQNVTLPNPWSIFTEQSIYSGH
jgi:predicted acetyltransferase